MNSEHLQSWGAHALQFKLPGALIHLTGLSAAQGASLRETYPGYVTETSSDVGEHDIECRAYRLDHAPAVLPQELTLDKQYAPKKIRRVDRIELTGINFEAQILFKSSQAPASLGVLHEHEFARPDVIENFLRVFAAHRALEHGGVVLHSAGLVFAGQACIFVGRSNAGKTTLTRKAHQSGTTVLSDDINLVLPGQQGYEAFAVPFTGEFGRFLDQDRACDSYPVTGIVLLERGDHLETKVIKASDAVARLLVGCPFVNTDEQESAVLFDVLTDVVARVPVIALQSRRDDGIERIMDKVKCGFDQCLAA